MPNPSRAAVVLLSLFLFCASYWIHRYFGRPDLNQIEYHLSFGVDLVRSADPLYLRRFVRWCVLAPLLLLALYCYAEARLLRVLGAAPGRLHGPLSWTHRRLPQLLLLAATLFWLHDVAAFQYATASLGRDYFGEHYVAPAAAAIRAEQPRNLILIYVESLEQGYAARGAFGANLLAPLDALPGASFASYAQAPGAGWTIAALVATQCGVPLERVTIFDGNTQGQMMDSFLGRAVCLPDILAAHGYRNVFLGGGSTRFAGKDKFLRQHHYAEVWGKEEWEGQGVPEAAMNGWGLYDADLFDRARARLRALSAAGGRFNLTILTVDTHEPEGYLSRRCAARGYVGFTGVVGCTAQEIAQFVRFARDEGYLEHTNVVILGDHLARPNPATAQLSQAGPRTIYNRFVARDAVRPNRQELLHFDLLPTILEFSGFAVEGGRLGLGYSGFHARGPAPPPTRLPDMERDLMNRSEEYLALWGPRRP